MVWKGGEGYMKIFAKGLILTRGFERSGFKIERKGCDPQRNYA